MKKQLTSDQKLLRLIEGDDVKELGLECRKENLFPLLYLKNYFNDVLYKLKGIPDKARIKDMGIDLRWVSIIAAAIFLVMGFYVVNGLLLKSSLYLKSAKGDKYPLTVSGEKYAEGYGAGNKNYELSDNNILTAKRNGSNIERENTKETYVILDEATQKIKNNLNLVGIIGGKIPQVLIENRREARTHLLNKGDMMGQVRVIDILKDKVILNFNGVDFDMN